MTSRKFSYASGVSGLQRTSLASWSSRFGRAAIFAGLVAIATIHPQSARSADSVYSTVDRQDDCIVLDKAAVSESEWIDLRCRGPQGNFVFISEDDLRTSVGYGKPALARDWQSFQSFNGVGETVEWRGKHDGDEMIFFAAIQRWFISYDQKDPQQVLVISTVAAAAGEESCMVGLVDARANPDANRLARQVADTEARRFRCDRDRPRYHGEHAADAPLP